MRPRVFSTARSSAVLTACVLAVALVATACTADDSSLATEPTPLQLQQDASQQDQDRGVVVDPLPTATPLVESQPSVAPSATPADVAPTFDRPQPRDLNGDGAITESEDLAGVDGKRPALFNSPATTRAGDFVSVDYAATPATEQTSSGPGTLPPIDTTTTTPDGRSIWVSIPSAPDAGLEATCGDGPGTRLGIESIVAPAPSWPAQPADQLPNNVSAIHHGPNNLVLLYTTCDAETRPAAFATVQPNGDFTNIVAVDELLAQTTEVHPPIWHWGGPADADYYGNIGTPIAAVPQRGLVATGESRGTPSQVFIDATTGRVLDVLATPEIISKPLGYDLLTSDGASVTVTFAGQLDLIDTPIDVVVSRQVAGPDAPAQALVGGIGGAAIVTPLGPNLVDAVDIERLGDRSVTAAAWAPFGPTVALSGPAQAGTWLHHGGETIELSDQHVDQLYFTPDGTRLVLASPGTRHVIEFAAIPEPDDSTAVTAFSDFDSGGLGPLRVEALVSELQEQLDMEFELDGISGIEPGYCVWISSPQLPGVSMLGEAVSTTDAIVTSIVVNSGPWSTPSGLRIGSAAADVFQAFPEQLRAEAHKYIAGNYLTFVPLDPEDIYSIKFETNGHQVIAMHAGRQDWISAIEGCA